MPLQMRRPQDDPPAEPEEDPQRDPQEEEEVEFRPEPKGSKGKETRGPQLKWSSGEKRRRRRG
jgi:hypothetical protein